MSRADRLAALVAERELDALLVREPTNLRWLTGFTGTNGLAVVTGARGARPRLASKATSASTHGST